MSGTINVKHMHEVFSDEAFVKELFATESPEDAQAALKAKGVELSIDDLKCINEVLTTKLSETGELSLDDLDDAAGGMFVSLAVGGSIVAMMTTKAAATIGVLALGGLAVGGAAVGGLTAAGIATGIAAVVRRW